MKWVWCRRLTYNQKQAEVEVDNPISHDSSAEIREIVLPVNEEDDDPTEAPTTRYDNTGPPEALVTRASNSDLVEAGPSILPPPNVRRSNRTPQLPKKFDKFQMG